MLARTLGQVRGLEKDPKPTVPYHTGARPIGAASSSLSSSPSSSSLTLPPVSSAQPIDPSAMTNTSALFHRHNTAPLTPASVTSTGQVTSVLMPVAGVDDPLLHTYQNVSVTGQTGLFTSQRLHDLAVSKQQRHFDALNGYRSWRMSFDRQLSDQTDQLASSLRDELEALEKPLKTLLFETMMNEDKLIHMDVEEIKRAEGEFHSTYETKQRAIDRLVAQLGELETTRANECTNALDKLVATWLDIAHLPAAECERQLAHESKELNVHLLRNSSAAHELGAVLTAELVVKQKEVWLRTWAERYQRWKELRYGWFLRDFLLRFERDDGDEPHDLTGLPFEREYPFVYSREKRRRMDEIVGIGRQFQAWTYERIKDLLQKTPSTMPTGLKAHIEAVKDELQDGYLRYDQQIDANMKSLQAYENQLHSHALKMVDVLFDHLSAIQAKSSDEVRADLAQHILPLLEERRVREQMLYDKVTKSLQHFDQIYLRCLDAFSAWYLQAGAKWEQFLDAMRTTNHEFDELLNEKVDEFVEREEVLEHRLKSELASLEHEPNIGALDERLQVVRALVGPEGEIEQLYRRFYDESLALTQEHPKSLASLVRSHASMMASQFGLAHPTDRLVELARVEEARRAAELEAKRLEEEEDAKLTKRERAKKEKMKKDKEREEQLAAEAEAKAKLAKLKAAQAEQAKAEKLRASQDAAAAAAATNGATGTDSPSASQQHTPSRSGGGVKTSKKSEEELMRDAEHAEETRRVLADLEHTLTCDIFYSLARYKKHTEDTGPVRLAAVTPLAELGRVAIEPAELDDSSPASSPRATPSESFDDAQTRMTKEEVEKYVTHPKPSVTVVEETPSNKKGARRSQSPTKQQPISIPDGPVYPKLELPPGVLHFTIKMDDPTLVDHILTGGSDSSSSSSSSGGGVDFLPSPSASTSAPSGASSLALSLGSSLETASERESRLQLERERLESDQAATRLQSATMLHGERTGTDAPAHPSTQERVATPNKNGARTSTTGGGKKKTAKEIAREQAEEAARLQAEEIERLKQVEVARLEEARREIERVPVDCKGRETLAPLAFPRDLLARMMARVRENFLVALEYEGAAMLALCHARNSTIAMDLVKQLNLRMREYKPRLNRIEVDIYAVRARALNSNLQQYNRFLTRLTDAFEQALVSWDAARLEGEKEVLRFKQRLRAAQTSLAELSHNPYGSLSELNAINTRVKQEKLQFQKRMVREIFQRLQDGVDLLKSQTRKQIENYVAACRRKQFGMGEYDHYADAHGDGAFLEELDAHGNVLSSSAAAAATAVASPVRVVASYHSDEVAYYSNLLEEYRTGFEHHLANELDKLAKLRGRYEELLQLSEFNSSYQIHLQTLSLHQGLGHSNGAPKRALTLALRSELTKSHHQEEFIQRLLDELELAANAAVTKGEIVEVGRNGKLRVRKATSDGGAKEEGEEEKEARETTKASTQTMEDLAAAFDGLQLSQTPVSSVTALSLSSPSSSSSSSSSSTLASHLLRLLDQLRRSLYARAHYLDALKPHLPALPMPPVTYDPFEVDRLESARRAHDAMKEEVAPSSSSKSRAKRLSSIAPEQTRSPSLGAIKTPNSNAMTGATTTTTTTTKTRTKSTIDEASIEAMELNKGGEQTFMKLVQSYVNNCKRDMATLLKNYETAHPDRKIAASSTAAADENSVTEEKVNTDDMSAKRTSSARRKVSSSSSSSSGGASGSGKKSARSKKSAPDATVTDASVTPVEHVIPPAIDEHCQVELTRGQQHLDLATKELLGQVDRAGRILVKISTTLLGDIFQRIVTDELQSNLRDSEAAFELRHTTGQRMARRNRDKLRPVLAARPDKSTLDLINKEDERYQKSIEDITQHRRRQLELLQSNSSKFITHLLHGTTSLLTLFDSMLLPVDLANVLKDGDILKARHGLKHLVKEANRLNQHKQAIASQVGLQLDEMGNVVQPTASGSAAATKGSRGSSSGLEKKKSATLSSAEVAAAQAASQELMHKLDPRYIRLTWPGLRTDVFNIPEDEHQRRAREAKEAEEAQAAQAAAVAAASEADGKKKRKGGKGAASAAVVRPPSPQTSEESLLSERSSGSGTPSTAKPSPHSSRRSKKQSILDEEAAAAAAQAELLAKQALVQTPSLTGLNQPSQRTLITTRDTIYHQYVQLYQQQVHAIVESSVEKLSAESKARKEWTTQIEKLINPEPLQF